MVDIWNFMCEYADSFWTASDSAFHIFMVLSAWAITLGFLFGLFIFGSVFFGILADILDSIYSKND